MPLTDSFNTVGGAQFAEKISDNVLHTWFYAKPTSQDIAQSAYFDFMTGTVAIEAFGLKKLVMFSELSRETLEHNRQLLIELEGHPVPLPKSKTARLR